MPREGRGLFDALIEIHDANLDSPFLAPVEAVDIPQELEESLRALGYVGSKNDSSSTSLFRQPLRRFDLEAHGFLGCEREGRQYLPALEFSAGEFPAEQLLYGWRKKQEGARGRDVVRRAGARLKRDRDQDSWRLEGKILRGAKAGGPLTLDVRVDGGEPRRFDLPPDDAFEIGGPLPVPAASARRAGRSYVRFDLECGGPSNGRNRHSNPSRYCFTAYRLGLE